MSLRQTVETRAQTTLRRTAVAATGLVGAAALADRLGGSATPFLLMAAALIPQVVALALALRIPQRSGWLRIDQPTTWFLRALVILALAAAFSGALGTSPFWIASLAAAGALMIAAWSPVVVAQKR